MAFHSLNLGFLCQVADNSVKCFPSLFTRELLFECSDHNKTAVHEPVILEKIVSAQLVSSEGTLNYFLGFYIVFNQYYSIFFIHVTSFTVALGVPNTAIPYKILANTKILLYIENQQNTYTTLIICHTCLKFHPSSIMTSPTP